MPRPPTGNRGGEHSRPSSLLIFYRGLRLGDLGWSGAERSSRGPREEQELAAIKMSHKYQVEDGTFWACSFSFSARFSTVVTQFSGRRNSNLAAGFSVSVGDVSMALPLPSSGCRKLNAMTGKPGKGPNRIF